ncbi:MAG: DUF2249 domain-containing protein, partial [Chitinophagaceae bacterium]
MIINANTKIAPILKQNAAALDAIISISPKFAKLRNPLLRKIMAGRTTLAMAARLGGCSVDDFYKQLEPLGFEIDRQTIVPEGKEVQVPDFLLSLTKEQLTGLDVRPVIASGDNPLQTIMEKIKEVQPGNVLKIINSFEPAPLIMMLEKKGFETYTDRISDDHVETYFYRASNTAAEETKAEQPATSNWEQTLEKFTNRLQQLDVRHLEMPQPMLAILVALDRLPNETALYVYHK